MRKVTPLLLDTCRVDLTALNRNYLSVICSVIYNHYVQIRLRLPVKTNTYISESGEVDAEFELWEALGNSGYWQEKQKKCARNIIRSVALWACLMSCLMWVDQYIEHNMVKQQSV